MKDNEKDLAAFYQEHRGDPENWGELEEAPNSARKRPANMGVTITVRLQADDAEALRRTAAMEQATYSDVVRKAILRYVQPNRVFEANHEYTLLDLDDKTPRTGVKPVGTWTALTTDRAITRSSAMTRDPLAAD